MNVDQLTSLAASGGQLALGLAVVRERARSTVAAPLALLCTLQFGWTFAALVHELSSEPAWRHVDMTLSPLVLPATLQVVLAFTGRTRSLRRALLAAYAAAGALALSSAWGFFAPWGRAWLASAEWSTAFLVLEALVVTGCTLLLVRHMRESGPAEERARTRLILAALLAAAVLGATELGGHFGLQVWSLGNLGALVSAALLVLASVRHRLLERTMPAAETVAAVLLAAAVLGAFLGLIEALRDRTALVVIGSLVILAAACTVAAQLGIDVLRERRRLHALALTGRLGEQLAHDLKNPLAALRGAIQFLDEERARGRSLDPHAQFLGLMTDQVDRILRVVDDYQRIGRVEPSRRSFDLHELVRRALALQPFANGGAVTLGSELTADPPSCYGDPDLLGLALENLLRNASEAMPEGGAISVQTRVTSLLGAPAIVLAVKDTGIGMDARQRERAFDERYTTKPRGTGLGLAFVRRVAEAQGGATRLHSTVGAGTTVEIILPSQPPPQPPQPPESPEQHAA